MSRKLTLSVVGLVGLVLLAGCIKAKTVVTVEKDGSGIVEQTMHTKALDLPFPGVEKPSPEEDLAKARELENDAIPDRPEMPDLLWAIPKIADWLTDFKVNI